MLREPIVPVIDIEKIMSIFYFEFAKNFNGGMDKHNFWEIVYVDRGEIIVTAGETKHVLGRGQAVFHKPNEPHNIVANNVVAPNVFIISFVCTSNAMTYFNDAIIDIPAKLQKYISQIVKETYGTCYFPLSKNQMPQSDFFFRAPFGSMQMIQMYLQQFLILLLREGQEKTESAYRPETEETESSRELIREMVGYLERHVYQKFSVSEMCQDFNYSTMHLSKVFKNTMGLSILEYYLNLKMLEARRMIREDNMNIAQIAQKLGYNSPQYFSRSFKRIVGMTPHEYKNSVLK
ncbi:MAG: AraC family transcriptional regulator [Ruminococcaceae bacterium]|nr:AraC family transcriptional regulator [Oscillospiraceae bacterium]